MFDLLDNPEITRNNKFHLACQSGDLDAVTRYINEGADIDTVRSDMPALLVAAHGQHWPIVRLLIEKGVECNCKNRFGWSPLHSAAEHGNEEIIRLLIESAAYVNRKDKIGKTPLYVAISNGKIDACNLLVSLGADPKTPTENNDTALHNASKNGYLDLIKLFFDKGAIGSVENDKGETPASVAKDDVVRALIEQLELNRSSLSTPVVQSNPSNNSDEGKTSQSAPSTQKRKILKA